MSTVIASFLLGSRQAIPGESNVSYFEIVDLFFVKKIKKYKENSFKTSNVLR